MEYLGYMLTHYRNHAMFPDDFHIIYSTVWILQSLLLLISSISTNRYLPSTNKPSYSLLTMQYDFALITHSLFYIIEISVTDIYEQYTGMLFHHIFAIILFSLLLQDKSQYCVIMTLPFIIHQIFWILGAQSTPLLLFYNSVFLIVGVVSVLKIRIYGLECGCKAAMMCIMISCINLYIYCDYYQNTSCPTRTEYLGYYRYDIAAWICLFFTLVMTSVVGVAEIVKRIIKEKKSIKTNLMKRF